MLIPGIPSYPYMLIDIGYCSRWAVDLIHTFVWLVAIANRSCGPFNIQIDIFLSIIFMQKASARIYVLKVLTK